MAKRSQRPMNIALYFGPGAGKSKFKVQSVFEMADFNVIPYFPDDLLNPSFSETFDVLVHSGGSARTQAEALGDFGRKQVCKHIAAGKGYIGICAGAYLATNYYDWSLGIVDARITDRSHWARGKGDCQVLLSKSAESYFGFDIGPHVCFRYAQGPLLTRPEWPSANHTEYTSLGVYGTDIAENGAPPGIMPGTTAILVTNYTKGRIGLFSTHPESKEATHIFLHRLTEWSASTYNSDDHR